MAKAPPIPSEQRSFTGDKGAGRLDSARPDRRDLEDNKASAQPGNADQDLDHQGRSGNLRQNLTPQRSVQDR
jgi:hypothetical protein